MALLRILSFNILSPIYAALEWYPGINKAYLNKNYRIVKILEFILSQRDQVDVFAFQEVNPREFKMLSTLLQDDFIGNISYNDPDYWLDSVIPPLKPKRNGTAIFLRSCVFSSINLAPVVLETGNNPIKATAVHSQTGKMVRILSVHYDSDIRKRRKEELKAVMRNLTQGDYIDIVVGDMNSSVDLESVVGKIYQHHNFIGVLEAVGKATPTHPWDQWKNDPSYNPVIDHIMVRGNVTPIDGETFSYGIMNNSNETTRIELTLKLTGSDHYAIKGIIKIN